MSKTVVVVLLTAVACLPSTARAGDAADTADWANGSRPPVLINWQSFEDSGFPSDWEDPFRNVVINCYTRLNRLLGVDVRPQFFGSTTNTVEAGKIVISANVKHCSTCNEHRLASRFGTAGSPQIVFHRRDEDDTPWNFTPFWPDAGEISMRATLMHELLHALGLDHNSAAQSVVGSGSIGWQDHFGPWSGDIADMRSVYQLRTSNRLRQLRTTDGGSSWSTLGNTITSFGSSAARTTHPVAVAGNNSDGSYLVGWIAPSNRLTWIRGNGVSFGADTWSIFGGGPEVSFGTALACDDGDTYLWAFVEGLDLRRVRVIRSDNHGQTWGFVGFPNVRTYGRPGLATTMIDGQRAWIVVWAHYDDTSQADTGYLQASVSFNNGQTWSPPHQVDSFYRIQDGVTIEANTVGECRVAFVWAGDDGTWEYGQNRVRTLRCQVTLGGQLDKDATCLLSQSSRLAPGVAWHAGADRFVLGIREQDFNTSLDSMRSTPSGCETSFLHIGGTTTHVAPGLGRSTIWNEVVMWFARE